MAHPQLQQIYESQYVEGEWEGPKWYQWLKPFLKDREQVAAAEAPLQSGKVLDVGCGEGKFLELVAPKATELWGTDILASRIELARKRLRPFQKQKKVSLRVSDLDSKLPLPTASFDVVSCLGVLEYTLDPYHSLSELTRVLKPKGVLIVEVPNLAYLLERIRLLTGNLVGVAHAPGWQGGRLHHFTFATFSELLQQSGIEPVKYTSSGFLAPIRRLWPSLLSANILILARKTR